jgi:hypothetical protein
MEQETGHLKTAMKKRMFEMSGDLRLAIWDFRF